MYIPKEWTKDANNEALPLFQRAIESAAPKFGIDVIAAPVGSDTDIVHAIEALAKPQPGGLIDRGA